MTRVIGLTFAIFGMATSAFASFAVAPELDSSSALTAITLLVGGAAVLRARLRR